MLEILKLIEPMASLFLGQRQMISEKSIRLSQEILNQLRRVITLVAMLVGSLVLFCLGMSYFIDRTLDQLDGGNFSFTPSLIFLSIFMAVCLIVVFYSTNKSVWTSVFKKDQEEEEAKQQKAEVPNQGANPIETAVSLLILDFVKEREFNRQNDIKKADNKDNAT